MTTANHALNCMTHALQELADLRDGRLDGQYTQANFKAVVAEAAGADEQLSTNELSTYTFGQLKASGTQADYMGPNQLASATYGQKPDFSVSVDELTANAEARAYTPDDDIWPSLPASTSSGGIRAISGDTDPAGSSADHPASEFGSDRATGGGRRPTDEYNTDGASYDYDTTEPDLSTPHPTDPDQTLEEAGNLKGGDY